MITDKAKIFLLERVKHDMIIALKSSNKLVRQAAWDQVSAKTYIMLKMNGWCADLFDHPDTDRK